jgi:predicted DNA-binding antitoxin AbrB/MazE fold protein
MPKIVRAIYEQGVFKPTVELDFPEGKEVQLIVWEAEPFQWATFKTSSAIATFTWEAEESRWRLTWLIEERIEVSEEVKQQIGEWQSVYEGLSEEDIAEVEQIALESRQRSSAHEGENL